MDELQKKIDLFIKSTTETLKLNKENSDTRIAEIEKNLRDEFKKYVDDVKKINVSLPGLAEEEEKLKAKGKGFSFFKAVTAIARSNAKDSDPWKDAEYELKIFTEARQRATVSGLTGAQGGYLIPIEVAQELLKPAIADIVMRTLGISVYENLMGDLPFPEITSRPILSWVKEASGATATGVAFGNRMMRPKTGNMLIKLSNRLQMQTGGVAEQLVREMMQEGISLGLDDMMMNGTGGDKIPLGIFQSADIPTSVAIGTAGGRLTIDKVAQMIADVQDQNYMKGTAASAGLLTHPRVLSGMKRERVLMYSGDTGKTGAPILNPLMTDANISDMLRLKLGVTTAVPHTAVKSSSGAKLAKALVGEFSQFGLGLWGGLAMKSSDVAGTAFENNELWITAFVDADTIVKQPKAFTYISDAQTDESKW